MPLSPVLCLVAVEVVLPVADAVLLVEGGVVGAHVRDAATVLVAHVEQLAVKFLVSVEADRSVGAVECKRDVGELFPSLHLVNKHWSLKINEIDEKFPFVSYS